jgi:hypothetical protein
MFVVSKVLSAREDEMKIKLGSLTTMSGSHRLNGSVHNALSLKECLSNEEIGGKSERGLLQMMLTTDQPAFVSVRPLKASNQRTTAGGV